MRFTVGCARARLEMEWAFLSTVVLTWCLGEYAGRRRLYCSMALNPVVPLLGRSLWSNVRPSNWVGDSCHERT